MKPPRQTGVIVAKSCSQVGFIRREIDSTVTIAGEWGQMDFNCPDSWFEVGDPAVIELWAHKPQRRGAKK
jgi:hypothetical protein